MQFLIKQELNMFKERTTTSFGLSIATGLALESIFEPTESRYDPERIIPNKVELNKHKNLIINGYTLIRNIINAHEERPKLTWLEKDGRKHLPSLTETLIEELHILNSLMSNYPKNGLYIFLPNYLNGYKNYNKNKESNLSYIENNLILIKLSNFIFKSIKMQNINFLVTNSHILPLTFNVMGNILLTHFTLDLVENKKVLLLESHTGVLKSEVEFYTKFNHFGNNDLIRIPLTPTTLYIMGDKSLVKSLGIKSKKILLEVAEAEKWNYKTNEISVKNKLLKTDLINEIKGNIY